MEVKTEYMGVPEVYIGKTGCGLPLDMLPIEGDKLPQNTKEAC